jgi:hypothetical protein
MPKRELLVLRVRGPPNGYSLVPKGRTVVNEIVLEVLVDDFDILVPVAFVI